MREQHKMGPECLVKAHHDGAEESTAGMELLFSSWKEYKNLVRKGAERERESLVFEALIL